MNISGINDFSNNFFTQIQKLKDTSTNYEVGSFKSLLSAAQSSSKDSLTEKYLNITDSMSRKNKISFAASIMTNKIMSEEINNENSSFMKNIASGFSSDEINSLKNEIRSFAASKNSNSVDVEEFLSVFDGIVNEQKQLGIIGKQQAKPALNNIDNFYRASLGI